MKKLIEWFWITDLGVYLTDNKKKVIKYTFVFIICILLLAFSLWIRYLVVVENYDWKKWPDWILFEKKLWDWMELLIIPVVLSLLVVLFNRSERKSDREAIEKQVTTERDISTDRQHEEALQAYFDMMMELVVSDINKGIKTNKNIQSMARVRTLILLNQLDGKRKGYVLEFLNESKLIEVDNPVIDLYGADFSGMRLSETNIKNANLQGVKFRRAILNKVNFNNSSFHEANIYDAMFALCE
jgi:hypothetical protein